MRVMTIIAVAAVWAGSAWAAGESETRWQHELQGARNAVVAGIAVEHDGQAALVYSRELADPFRNMREHIVRFVTPEGELGSEKTLFRYTDLVITRLITNDEGGFTASGRKRTRAADPYRSWIGVFDRDLRLLRTVSLSMGSDDRVLDLTHTAGAGYAVAGTTLHPRDRVRTSWLALLRPDLHRRALTLFPAPVSNIPASVIPLPLGGVLLAGTRSSEVNLAELDENLKVVRRKSFPLQAPAETVHAFSNADGSLTVLVNTTTESAETAVEALFITDTWELERRVRLDIARISRASAAVRSGDGGYVVAGSVTTDEGVRWAAVGLDESMALTWYKDGGDDGADARVDAVAMAQDDAMIAAVTTEVLSEKQKKEGELPKSTVSLIRLGKPDESGDDAPAED